RMVLLPRTKDAEHVRQCSNFLAEIGAFDDLINQNIKPHWVPETKVPMPDLQYSLGSVEVPVEVKHLNSPRIEHDTLFSGKSYGGSVDKNYQFGLRKKIIDFVNDARVKFVSFNKIVNKINSSNGTLYLFFSKSIDAGLLDNIKWEKTMGERIKIIAEPLMQDDLKLIVIDI